MIKTRKIMDTAIHFSGGIDSVNVAWNYLRNNPDKVLLIHHINLRNREKRADHELKAVRDVLEWFRTHGLDNFKYIETLYEQADELSVQFDVYFYIGYMTPVLFKSYSGLKYLLRPAISDDYPPNVTGLDREKDAETACAAFLKNKNPIWLRPNLARTKKDEIAEMPYDLFKLTWRCRFPYKREGKVCHTCRTCKIVDQALTELNLQNPHD